MTERNQRIRRVRRPDRRPLTTAAGTRRRLVAGTSGRRSRRPRSTRWPRRPGCSTAPSRWCPTTSPRCASTSCWRVRPSSTGWATATPSVGTSTRWTCWQRELDDRRRKVQLLLRWASWHFHHSEYEEQAIAGPGRPSRWPDRRAWPTWRPTPCCGGGGASPGRAPMPRPRTSWSRRWPRPARPTSPGSSARACATWRSWPTTRASSPGRSPCSRRPGPRTARTTTSRARARCWSSWARCCSTRARHREARAWLEECLPIFVASGHKYRQAVVKSNLGAILLQEGELGQARRLITEGLALCQELDDREGVAVALGVLGDTLRRAGDHERAQENLRTVDRAWPARSTSTTRPAMPTSPWRSTRSTLGMLMAALRAGGPRSGARPARELPARPDPGTGGARLRLPGGRSPRRGAR